MSKPLLIRGARQLLTLRGAKNARRGAAMQELGAIADGAVLIEGTRIAELGPSRRVLNLAPARTADVIDAAGCVVMPAFIDCHTHPVFGGAPGSSAGERVVHRIPAGRLRHGMARRAAAFAFHGTLTFEAKTGYGGGAAGEMKSLRTIAALDGAPLDVLATVFASSASVAAFGGTPAEYIEWLAWDLLPKIKSKSLARALDFDCDAAEFRRDNLEALLRVAGALGFDLHLHAEHRAHHGVVQLAVALGVRSAAHLDHADEFDVEMLANSRTVAALIPGEAFHAGREATAPARALIDAGAAVALATGFDIDASPSVSMPMAIALACRTLRMNAAEAVVASTINAAAALGLAHRIGSLERGKQADLLLLDIPDYRDLPHAFGVNPVRACIKRGKVIYQRGGVRTLDLEIGDHEERAR